MAEKQEVSSGAGSPAALCANGCGYYGSAAFKNLCSKCYNDAFRIPAAPAITEKTTTVKPEISDGTSGNEATIKPEISGGGSSNEAMIKPEISGGSSSNEATIKPEISGGSSDEVPVAPPSPVPPAPEATAAATEKKQEEPTAAPIRCVGGCGFFGSALRENYCSMCHFDYLRNKAPDDLLNIIKAGKAVVPAAGEEQPPVPAAEEEESPAVEAPKAAPSRCHSCRKKVGLLGFSCRCGSTFCSMHRLPEKHGCEFDFKKAGRDQLAKKNPLVVAPKIDKI